MGYAIVTLISARGRTARKEGRMVVSETGEFSGTIGGGKSERLAIDRAVGCIHQGKGGKFVFPFRDRGEIEVFIDVVNDIRKAYLVGSGHVSRAVREVLSFTGWNVNTVESAEELDPGILDHNCAVVIFDPEKANEVIDRIKDTEVFYIGVLSSRSREGYDDERIHCPVGLDIGSRTPEEIAVSIAAEIMSCRAESSGRMQSTRDRRLVVVRGAGDLATGVIIRLRSAGFRVVALDIEKPTVIRRTVSFADALYDGTMTVEGVTARRIESAEKAYEILDRGEVPVLVDPEGKSIEILHPVCVVDAIIAKRNMGTVRTMAPLVIALGPGFTAGVDCDVVIETKRGHSLGSLIHEGSAIPNSGIPGIIGGYGKERVVHSPASGITRAVHRIGDIVPAGEILGYVGDVPFRTVIAGRIRGMIRDGLEVPEHFKIADVDPRGEDASYTTVSDKARAIAGGVLEALDNFVRG